MKRVVAANWPRTRQTQSKEEMEGYRCSTINRIRYVEEVQKCGDEDHREGEREREWTIEREGYAGRRKLCLSFRFSNKYWQVGGGWRALGTRVNNTSTDGFFYVQWWGLAWISREMCEWCWREAPTSISISLGSSSPGAIMNEFIFFPSDCFGRLQLLAVLYYVFQAVVIYDPSSHARACTVSASKSIDQLLNVFLNNQSAAI